MAEELSKLRYIDIGINFTDPIFRGIYHDKQRHDDDFEDIIQRALDAGCKKFMVTGSDLAESKHALEISKAHPGLCYATIGVHPCSAKQFDDFPGGPAKLLSELKELAIQAKEEGTAVAYGEFGLDYDRLFLTPKEQQLKYFELQLEIAVEVQLPLFLHSRAASEDFERLLKAKLEQLPKRGLVHSFTGTVEEMQRLVELGFDIGVNGCSMKTDENIDVVRQIPLERLQIETDGPWCEMRPSHASAKFLKDAPPLPKAVKKEKFVKGSMVKGRNEPATIPHVAYAIAQIKGIAVEEVCNAAWNNSINMFGLGESA
ncbi:deoxyribonuclease tatD [Didymella exigua CBS 183.55]|uniref:Deoxyribonuclease tatD n=1 Tax=Didymella exigua CBS 183.55 TaxID=1150837 RepID=A0A6A5RJM4_9PLEO|nr:deoxyribonuclease tatD [Didymella exigua CBS 183.55]KAF1928591.1 deoxyribonuclease tatD [Didymella exigua CBS 183.55]